MNQNEDSFSGVVNVIPVLDYGRPEPRKGVMRVICEAFEPAIDFVGGAGVALFVSTTAFIGFGVSISGVVGAFLVLMGGGLLFGSIQYWARSSRW